MPVCGYVVKSLVWTVESAAQKILFISALISALPLRIFSCGICPQIQHKGNRSFPCLNLNTCEKKITP